jgi:hypothetical protein
LMLDYPKGDYIHTYTHLTEIACIAKCRTFLYGER